MGRVEGNGTNTETNVPNRLGDFSPIREKHILLEQKQEHETGCKRQVPSKSRIMAMFFLVDQGWGQSTKLTPIWINNCFLVDETVYRC